MRRFVKFFLMQFLSYGLICWSIRSVARGWMWNIVASDLLIAALSFEIISAVAEAKKDRTVRLAYMAGGAAGSVTSVLLTKKLWGS